MVAVRRAAQQDVEDSSTDDTPLASDAFKVPHARTHTYSLSLSLYSLSLSRARCSLRCAGVLRFSVPLWRLLLRLEWGVLVVLTCLLDCLVNRMLCNMLFFRLLVCRAGWDTTDSMHRWGVVNAAFGGRADAGWMGMFRFVRGGVCGCWLHYAVTVGCLCSGCLYAGSHFDSRYCVGAGCVRRRNFANDSRSMQEMKRSARQDFVEEVRKNQRRETITRGRSHAADIWVKQQGFREFYESGRCGFWGVALESACV